MGNSFTVNDAQGAVRFAAVPQVALPVMLYVPAVGFSQLIEVPSQLMLVAVSPLLQVNVG